MVTPRARPHRTPRRASRIAFAALALLALFPGCKVNPARPSGSLTPADFVARGASRPAAPQPGAEAPAAAPPPAARTPPSPTPIITTPEAAREGLSGLTVRPGLPEDIDGPVVPMERAEIVDAMVGDINGRPIFAAEFLGPLEARLRALAEEKGMTRVLWQARARQLIRSDLQTLVADELLISEARRALKPEQKAGLFNFINELAEEQRRRSGGSRALAAQQLAEQGETEEEAQRKRENETLLSVKYSEIFSRVVVQWRDVVVYYENNPKKFRPDPVAYFRRLDVADNKPEAIARVKAALDSGVPFAEVAAGPDNEYKRAEGGLDTRTVVGEYATNEFFGLDALNTAAHSLKPGGWTHEPIRLPGTTAWLYLEKVEKRERALTDRDVQLIIIDELTVTRRTEEVNSYVRRLVERARFGNADEIVARLLDLATRWYWPEGRS